MRFLFESDLWNTILEQAVIFGRSREGTLRYTRSVRTCTSCDFHKYLNVLSNRTGAAAWLGGLVGRYTLGRVIRGRAQPLTSVAALDLATQSPGTEAGTGQLPERSSRLLRLVW